MTLALPWHSSTKWNPSEVTEFVSSLSSGAGTLIVETDAGRAYLKALGNPDGPHALAKELLGTYLSKLLGLPTFDFAVIEVTELDDLRFTNGTKAEPGPAFVTRGEIGQTWGDDDRLLEKIDNPDSVAGLVIMDTWLRNKDRYFPTEDRKNLDNVFFSTECDVEGMLSLRVMDFSHAIKFGGDLTKRVLGINDIKDDAVFGLFPRFRKKLCRDAIQRLAGVLAGLSLSQIENAVALIPNEWQLETAIRQALKTFLLQRARFVAETIESQLLGPQQLTIDLSEGGEG